jgi:hypothetical protein
MAARLHTGLHTCSVVARQLDRLAADRLSESWLMLLMQGPQGAGGCSDMAAE